MSIKLSMYRLLCCRSRNSSSVEVDEVTDSLEKCLSFERGVTEFKSFLEKNHFEEESRTLAFLLKCDSILNDISRLSPYSREMGLPGRIERDIRRLHAMAENVNFDLLQMNSLNDLRSNDVEKKIYTLQSARSWTLDILRDIYRTFRKQNIRTI